MSVENGIMLPGVSFLVPKGTN